MALVTRAAPTIGKLRPSKQQELLQHRNDFHGLLFGNVSSGAELEIVK
ncbi:hypothetical protein N184_23060 [Sinorhizobium sp. GL28]|nr:hypothetical protein N184_23060 [Sinorhizobium sp. GL28]